MNTISCLPSCCDTTVAVNVPGNPGATGAAGSSAFTTLTANLTLPAAAGPVVGATTVADSTWLAIGQVVFISDGVDWAHFRILTIPSATSVTLEWLDYADDAAGTSVIGSGGAVTAGGTEPSLTGLATSGANSNITSLSGLTTPLTRAQGGTQAATATAARASLGAGGANLAVYAAGTVYPLTATPALLDFGTTDPSLTITSPGVWLIIARVRIDNNAKTTAAVRTITLLLRRTNNTAADLPNSTMAVKTEIMTTLTFTLTDSTMPLVVYTTTNSNDIIQLWGSADDVSGAGTFDAVEASIVAARLYDQTA